MKKQVKPKRTVKKDRLEIVKSIQCSSKQDRKPGQAASDGDAEKRAVAAKKSCVIESMNNGVSATQAGAAANINMKTFYKWYHTDPEFRDLVEKARVEMISVVRDSLIKIANGYDYDEETIETAYVYPRFPKFDSEGKPHPQAGEFTGEVIEKIVNKKKTRKHVVPNLGAIAFFLCNRDPKEWKHILKAEVSPDKKGMPVFQIIDAEDVKEKK